MFPILIQLGPIPIHTYGFLIAIGFLTAMHFIKKNSIQAGLPVEKVLDLAFWSLLVGFAGARTLFVITRWDYFSIDLLSVFKIWEGGLVFFGGPLAATPFIVWYLKKHKIHIWKTMDAMVPGLAIAHALGRLGCLAAGCCYGKPTGTDFGIKLYSDLVDTSHQGIHLHPTQIYEASAMGILFLGLMFLQKRKKFDGQVVLTYFMTYPIIRSFIEIYRGDIIRGFIIDEVLSTSQFISILVFIAAFIVLVVRLNKGDLSTPSSNNGGFKKGNKR